MKKIYSVIILLVLAPFIIDAQGVYVYHNVTRETGITYNSINSTGSSISSWRGGGGTGDNRSNQIPIGFTFNYLGVAYTMASVSTNGFIDLSSSTAGGYDNMPYGYDNASFSLPAPSGTLLAITPFYEDLMCTYGATLQNSIKFLTSGTTGNKVFTVEWINMTFPNSFNDKVNFQVKLYEASSDIEFVYGSMTQPTNTTPSYTCGINADSISAVPASSQLLCQQTANSISFSHAPQNSLSTVPTSNTKLLLDGCILPAPAGTMTGPSDVCENSSGVTYSVPVIANATSYNWTLPSGFTITSGNGTRTIVVSIADNAVSGPVTVSGSNSCGTGNPTVKQLTVNQRPSPTISGPLTACSGTTGHTYTTQSGMNNYTWTISAGGTIVSGAGTSFITVSWNTAGNQSVSVNYQNTGGCAAITPASYAVTVNPRPVVTVSGPNSCCINSSGNVYTTQSGMTDYQWTISAGGTITAGGTSTSNTATVSWNTTGAKTVSVNYANANDCSGLTAGVQNVNVNPLPVPTVGGPASVCVNSTGNVYTTQSGMTNYLWTVSTGGTIVGANNASSVNITWNSTGSQSVSVTYKNGNGCTAASPTTYTVNVNARPSPTITGPASACAGTSGHVYSTQTSMTNYQWSLTSGGTIMSGQGTASVTVTWNAGGPQTVYVNYSNASNCNASTAAAFPVTINPAPVAVISGPPSVCLNSTGNIYSTQSAMSNYIWKVSSGGTITAGGATSNNTVTVRWDTAGPQSVSVGYTNAQGCSSISPTSYPVTVNPLPSPLISGPDSVCIGTSGHIYATESGMSNYNWTISAGGTITAGSGTSAITVSWNTAGNQSVSVNYTNGNGCTAPAASVFNVAVIPLPVPVVSGSIYGCLGTSDNLYYTEPGMSNYTWTISSGGTITSGLNTDSIRVTWNTQGAQSITLSYINETGCATASPTIKDITVHALPVPTISGSAAPCANSGNYNYSTETGMSDYLWTITTGGNITGGQGTAQIQVSWFGTGSQTLTVHYISAQGCIPASPTILNVNLDPIPVPAGIISGTSAFCGPASGIPYWVDPVTYANTYIWSLPQGAVIVSGAGTNAIFVDFPANSSSGNISVSGHNNCGNGMSSPSFPVLFTPVPLTPEITREGDLLISSVADSNQWYYNNTMLAGERSKYLFAFDTGYYWSQVSVNGCMSDTSYHFYVDVITGKPEYKNNQLMVYPNPNHGSFRIIIPIRQKFTLKVFNTLGVMIFSKQETTSFNNSEFPVDLGNLPDGVYTIVIDGTVTQASRKILVNKQ